MSLPAPAAAPPPLRPSPRRPLAVLFLASAVTMLGIGMVSSILGLYARDLGASAHVLAVLFGVFAVSRAAATPVVGAASDRFDKRTVILAGLLLLALIAILYIGLASIPGLIAVRFMHGLSSAMVIPVALARVAELAPEGREGETMGTFSVSIVLGMAAGPAIGGALAERGGFGAAFGALAGLALLGLAIVAIGLPRRVARAGSAPVTLSMRVLFADPAVRAVGALRFLTASAIATLVGYLPLHGLEHGIGPATTGGLLTVSLVVAALVQRGAGRLADRGDAATTAALGVGLLGFALCLVGRSTSLAVLVPLTLLIGLARAVAVAAGGGLSARLGRSRGATGTVMGVVNLGLSMGLGVGPFVAGLAMGIWGTGAALAVVGAATMAAAVPAWFGLRRAAASLGGAAGAPARPAA